MWPRARGLARAMAPHTTLGTTSSGQQLSLSLEDRLRHIAIIGATGAGKSTLLRYMIAQDIARGDGLLVLDPMGDLSEAVLGDVPHWRHNHVCFVNVADLAYPVGLNVLEDTFPDDRARVVDGVVSAFRALHFDSWGPRLELILRHACTALIETPNASLALLPRLLTDDPYRSAIVARLSNDETRTFFGARFEKWRENYRDEAIDPVLNKVEPFLAFPAIKHILGQARSTVDFDHAMQRSRIVIINLSMGSLGEGGARLMGGLVLGHVRAAAMARARIPLPDRKPFHIIVDEAHAYPGLARLLSELRQFGISITLSTQFLDGLSEAARASLLGNAKTTVAFRCSAGDAAILARGFNRLHQDFNETALLELDDGEAMIATAGRDVARVDVPAPVPIGSNEIVKRQSRRHYGTPRCEVEGNLKRALGYVKRSAGRANL
jgi:hypothetical protein